jgi:hypothetical protein
VFRSWKTKGPRPVRLNTAKTVFVHWDSKNCHWGHEGIVFFCTMIPLDEKYIIQNNYEFWWKRVMLNVNKIYFTLFYNQFNRHVSAITIIKSIYKFYLCVWLAINSEQVSNQHFLNNTFNYTPAPRRGRGVYCFTSVRPSVRPIYFSSHFSQQLLMAEIWYLVTSFI